MLIIPSSVKIHLALGHTDLRKASTASQSWCRRVLKKDSFSGYLFASSNPAAPRLIVECPTTSKVHLGGSR